MKIQSVHDLLAKLTGVKELKLGVYQADCPVPGHKHPSGHLTVTDAGDKALVACHNQHSYEEICRALGFQSLSYNSNGSKPAPVTTTRLNDREAMAELKRIYGLIDATIKHFSIEPDCSKQAWRYPVTGGTRFKSYNRKSPNKYRHANGTPNQLYGLENVPNEIAEVWLLNGEPAIWVSWQASIPAICGIYGEGKLPENIVQELKVKGIQSINIPYDLDVPGEEATVRDYEALNSAFKVRIRQLPAHLGEHGDVCDLYNWCGGDPDAFRQALEGLPEIDSETLGNELVKGTPLDKEAVTLVCMADVEAESVSWLWCPYIPQSKLTLLEGDPGVGKSWVSLAIATAVSLGKGLPESEATEPAKVLLASAEDGLGDTIRPRLDAMKANVANIIAIDGALTFDDGGLLKLEGYIESLHPALVILDPLVAYLGAKVDLHRANETRAVMSRLAHIAEKYDVAILSIRHLTKGGAARPIYRGIGSIDFTASCRSVLLAGCDPENPQNRGLVHIKSNLAHEGDAIGFELRDGNFYWTGECSLTAGQILATEDTEHTSALDEAIDFLKEELTDGPVPASEILSNARSAGLSEKTVRRAKSRLGISTRRQGETGKRGGGRFTWELPNNHLQGRNDLDGQDGQVKNVGHVNQNRHKNTPLTSDVSTLNPNPQCETILGMSDSHLEGHLENPEAQATDLDDTPPYPTQPCPACGCGDFWLTDDNRWLCRRCHPKPGEGV